MSASEIVHKIIKKIRKNVIVECEGLDNCPQWDNYHGGAGWIDNEIGFFEELYKILGINLKLNTSNIQSVDEYIKYLIDKFNLDDINSLYSFVKNGGTSNKFFWEIINLYRSGEYINNKYISNLKEILHNYKKN